MAEELEGFMHCRAAMWPQAPHPHPTWDSGYFGMPSLPRFAGTPEPEPTAHASTDDVHVHHPRLNDPRFGITPPEYPPPLEALAQWTDSSSQFTGMTTPSEALGHFDVEPSARIEGATSYVALNPSMTGIGRLDHPGFRNTVTQHRAANTPLQSQFSMQAAPTPAPDAAPARKPSRKRGTKRSRKFVL
jgi:hypothetical protein